MPSNLEQRPRDSARRSELPGGNRNQQLSQGRVPPPLRPLAPKTPSAHPRGIEKAIKRREIKKTDLSKLEVVVHQDAIGNRSQQMPTFTKRPTRITPAQYTPGLMITGTDVQPMLARDGRCPKFQPGYQSDSAQTQLSRNLEQFPEAGRSTPELSVRPPFISTGLSKFRPHNSKCLEERMVT